MAADNVVVEAFVNEPQLRLFAKDGIEPVLSYATNRFHIIDASPEESTESPPVAGISLKWTSAMMKGVTVENDNIQRLDKNLC